MPGHTRYRLSDLHKSLSKLGYTPLDVMLAGSTGSGKSSFVNALAGREVAKVGCGVDPETIDADPYTINAALRIWDTPGFGDGVDIDERHKEKITEILKIMGRVRFRSGERPFFLIDLAVVVIEGSHRDIGTVVSLLNDVIIPNIDADRILVAINKADMSMSGRHWDEAAHRPDDVLLARLDEQAESIRQRVKESTGVGIARPICFSAEANWNIDSVLDMVIEHIPKKRREAI